jgi:hypothetical protein
MMDAMKLFLSFLTTLLISQSVYAQSVTLKPASENGLLVVKFLDLDEADQAIKASAGKLYGYYIFNGAGTVRYFKLYDALAADVAVGTTTPVLTIPVPAGAAAHVEFAMGIAFVNGITAACVTGVADNSTGAPGANECVANFLYR